MSDDEELTRLLTANLEQKMTEIIHNANVVNAALPDDWNMLQCIEVLSFLLGVYVARGEAAGKPAKEIAESVIMTAIALANATSEKHPKRRHSKPTKRNAVAEAMRILGDRA